MKKFGLTGCIGSGKSTVSRIFMQLGIPVYDADSRAKWLMQHHPDLIQAIQSLLGTGAYQPDGSLNRAFISTQVFQSPALLAQLNALVHPEVFADFDQWSRQYPNAPYLIKEAALMFESDSYKQVDKVIVVTAPEDLRIQRTVTRDGITRDAVLARMKNQWTEEQKLAKAHYRVINDESHLLIPQVLLLHQQFIQQV